MKNNIITYKILLVPWLFSLLLLSALFKISKHNISGEKRRGRRRIVKFPGINYFSNNI